MKIFVWQDFRDPGPPRVLLERGECAKGQCKAWSVSISDGSTGITARFESREEFEMFFETGELTERRWRNGEPVD